jgi:hypothetical protein
MSKSEVVYAVKDYLLQEGYETKDPKHCNGIDLVAANEYHTLLIEGSGNKEGNDELDTYFSSQMNNLLKNYEKHSGITLVMANPDTPFIRLKAEEVKTALDELGVVRFWVKKDLTIEWE